MGKNVEFSLEDKIIDDSGRFIILLCLIQGLRLILINYYAPNTESNQVKVLKDISDSSSSLKIEEPAPIIWGGDFNCSLSSIDTDGGNFKAKYRSKSIIESFLEEHEMIDIWRLRHPDEKCYTWRTLNPIIQRRLDYFLVSDTLQANISSCNIISNTFSDHLAITLQFN